MTKHDPIYLEGLNVGDEYRSDQYLVETQAIIEFAQAFDPQVFHLDAELAKNTMFQGLAASGWHTAAISMKLIVGSVPFGNGIIGAGGEISWPQPTRPNDMLQVVSKIVSIKPSTSKPDRGMVTIESLTLNQRGETCQRLLAKLVIMRKQG